MILSYKTQDVSFTDDVNELLCQIDVKMADMAKIKLDSARYGACDKVDEGVFFILANYRDILYMKAKNSCCLKGFLIDDIISVIKQYLASGKVQKFQKNV